MPFHVRNEETERAVRALAKALGVGVTEAVGIAAREALQRRASKLPLAMRLRPLREEVGLLRASMARIIRHDCAIPGEGAKIFLADTAITAILEDPDGGASGLTTAVEGAERAFTSQVAARRAERLLMDRNHLPARMAHHAVEGFIALAGVKTLPVSDAIYASALEARERHLDRRLAVGANAPPDDDALLDDAFCAQFRVPLHRLAVEALR
ncbi:MULTISPECIES: type II toxin-antitoxin system VapB family antitoxin [unclassified Xanthobacter]|uniref:type II toxin-antitoxin system VapB family antitoxin n=1 Tax=unclassified Xanthobacter TaxID=2623496 RepID=UPI001F3CD0B0|nr:MULTISPECIES: type II toxin-antitoxin system VapB family antitoxin [unclassified Xanthobacter]